MCAKHYMYTRIYTHTHIIHYHMVTVTIGNTKEHIMRVRNRSSIYFGYQNSDNCFIDRVSGIIKCIEVPMISLPKKLIYTADGCIL